MEKPTALARAVGGIPEVDTTVESVAFCYQVLGICPRTKGPLTTNRLVNNQTAVLRK